MMETEEERRVRLGKQLQGSVACRVFPSAVWFPGWIGWPFVWEAPRQLASCPHRTSPML